MPPANSSGSGSGSGSASKPAWHTFVAGALSGLVSEAATYPISTAKARLQVQRVAAGATPLYRSTAQTIAYIAQREGAAKLYSGFGSVLVCCAPARAVYFTAYEHCKKVCAATVGGGDGSHPAVGFIAGQIAQLSGSAIWVPQDVVKERMQVQALEPAAAPAHRPPAAAGAGASAAGAAGPEAAAAHKAFTGSFDAARRIVAVEGVRGLYRGYVAHQVVWVPYNGIFFSAYETCKSWWSRYLLPKPTAAAAAAAAAAGAPAPELPHFAFPACAAAAGAFASTVTYPMDLIKTRLQTQGNSGAYAGAVDCARQIVAKEGARALFRGLGARVLFLAPNHALSMTTYEKLMAVFDAGSRPAAASAK